MKKIFFIKCTILLLVAAFVFGIKIYIDTFNVFHWKDIRFIQAAPNKNFIKTKYILSRPKDYNAFLFGSSRIGFMPPVFLPKDLNKQKLKWYNMSYPTGIPKENLETIKTFIKNGVKINIAIVQFDELAMTHSLKMHEKEYITMPYQVYEQNKLHFYLHYLKAKTELSIAKNVLLYDKENHNVDSQNLYSYGTYGNELDFSEIVRKSQGEEQESYQAEHDYAWTEKESNSDLAELVSFCKENKIKLLLLTTPLYQTTYKQAVSKGYLEFLQKAAQTCEFYNFSSLNNFTKDSGYYLEWCHFRPKLGLILEKMLFGTEEEKEQIRQEAGDELWGIKVDKDNIDFVIQELRKQLKK